MSKTTMLIHPFHMGWKAREAGQNPNDNPYRPGSKNWQAWRHGWSEAEEYIGEEKPSKDLAELERVNTLDSVECTVEYLRDGFNNLVVRIEALEAENVTLRKTLSDCAFAAGGFAAPECSLEFMALIPEEIRRAIVKSKGSDK